MRKILLASAALLALAIAPAAAQQVILGTGVTGGSEAAAGSNAGAGTLTFGNGVAATAQRNTTVAGAGTALRVNGGLTQSQVVGASVAGTRSTSAGAGFSLGAGASVGGSSGSGSAGAGSQGFGGFGLSF